MPHEISVRTDGRAEAFFSMNEPAWHGLGKVVAGTLNSADALLAANRSVPVCGAVLGPNGSIGLACRLAVALPPRRRRRQ